MATIVLVHGGGHGGWCWRKIAPTLRALGHEVYTPTLTGLGERSHLLSPRIDLDLHVHDIVGVLEFEDLHHVVLVGHSYAGMVITGVADVVRDRIAHLVFLDAVLPVDGESLFGLLDPEWRAVAAERVQMLGETSVLPTPAAGNFGVTDPTEAAWLESKLTVTPARPCTDALRSTAAAWSLPGTYVQCLRFPVIPAKVRERAAARARVDPIFRFVTLDSGHDAMLTVPRELTALIDEVANAAGDRS